MSRREARATREKKPHKPLWKRPAPYIWLGVVLLVIGAAMAGGFAAKRLYGQAMTVKSQLQSAMADVQEVKGAVLALDTETAQTAAARLTQKTAAAKAGTRGRLWEWAEKAPYLGDDLTAVRLVAETTDKLATDVVAPASRLSLATFQPKDGRIDVAAVQNLLALIDSIDAGVGESIKALEPIDRDGLIPEVQGGVTKLDNALTEIQPLLGPVRDVVSVLPNALGANGPRSYLLMFQGTSEARSLGGNAAVFTVLEADNGALATKASITSFDFRQPLRDPVVPLDPEAVAIYGEKIGEYTPDFTMVPDFPEAVRILKGWWAQEGLQPASAALSIDPVALSYILSATGPITLATGEVLSAENAVSLLLNEVYFKYRDDPFEQDDFFTATADAVFEKITSGGFSPTALMAAVTKAVEEHRLLYVSDDGAEMALVAKTPMTGVMPQDSPDKSVLGVYVNDNTGSKMSYYLDMAINSCVQGSALHGQVTLTSNITPEVAADLPKYVSGPYFEPGTISSYVAIYGPAGTTPSNILVDGAPVNILSSGIHLGRPVFKVEVLNKFQSSHTVSFTFGNSPAALGAAEIWHTPMTRATAVTANCG